MTATNTTAANPDADLAPLVQCFLSVFDWFSDRFDLSVPQIVNLAELQPLPVGSLGRSLADFLDQHQLQPFENGLRRKQLHDSVHVLTGYGSDPLGEAEVQAFLVGAKFSALNLAIGLGLLVAIRRNHLRGLASCPPALVRQRCRAAYQRGCRSCFDPNRWQPETQWALPLAQVRQQYNL